MDSVTIRFKFRVGDFVSLTGDDDTKYVVASRFYHEGFDIRANFYHLRPCNPYDRHRGVNWDAVEGDLHAFKT